MKRILPLIAVVIIAFISVSDAGLLLKYQRNPNAYAAMQHVSFLHDLLLHKWGIQFALFKLVWSGLLLMIWLWQLVRPSGAGWIRSLTTAYALLWTCIGVLVLTGVVGVLQQVAGVPVRYFDFALLVSGMRTGGLAALVAVTALLPLVLVLLPIFNDRVQARRLG